MNDYTVFRQRRERFLQQTGSAVAVLATAPERPRNRDSHYPYRYDSHFYYLTGFEEPEAVLVLHAVTGRSILFCRDKDPEREIWDGFRYGPAAAAELFGFDEAYSITQLDERLPGLLADQAVLHYALGADAAWDARVIGWLNTVRGQARSGTTAPAEVRDVRVAVDAMRLIKDDCEQDLMRRSAAIASAAHRRAMQATRPGGYEYQVEAEILHEFRSRGAQSPAYTSIVAGGPHACVLHYVENNALLRDGDLLLIDAGCELDGYASDITRTFPVNGKFSAVQRDVYETVLSAQAAALEAIRPGASWQAPHEAAVRILAQGLVDFGLCRGSVEGVIESGDYRRFYMHRTGHWLGLDVHDVGDYKSGGEWRLLEPGMTLTVEPGCYIRPADDVPEAFWNIGIRIEDDVLVTAQDKEIFSASAPKSVADIEALMAARR
ncbi:MAG TPA: Xaa-Pro aminopeptidase [Burkholderiales bacterium]|nr:Xaa-Pro aminopeptidase [Burkholderiales bacterium]